MERKNQELSEHNRLEILKEQLKDQAAIDNERIEYRRQVMNERKQSYEQKKLAEKIEAEIKEKKVEKFLETIKPNVDTNPARMMSFTLVSVKIVNILF